MDALKFDRLSSPHILLSVLIIICIASVILSVILYLFLYDSSKRIENISIEYVKSNSINVIDNLREIIQNKIQTVASNLQIMGNAPAIVHQNISGITNLEVSQDTSKDITEGYGWIDENGKTIWVTTFTSNKSNFEQFSNYSILNNPYFQIPKETFKPYVTDAFSNKAYNHISRFIFSYPILSVKTNSISNIPIGINATNLHMSDYPKLSSVAKNYNNLVSDNISKTKFKFMGIVTASIDISRFKNFIETSISQLNVSSVGNSISQIKSPQITGPFSQIIVSIFDRKGQALFSNVPILKQGSYYNSTDVLQYNNIFFDDNTSKILSTYERQVFNDNTNNNADFKSPLEIKTKAIPGSNGASRLIINSIPILVNNEPVLYLFTITPFTLSDTAIHLINNQLAFTFLFIGFLMTMVFSFITIVMTINKRLKREVNKKTSQLKENVIKLENSNKELKLAKQSLEDINKEVMAANEKLLKNDESQKVFINTAAHELRTPTQAISGYCEINDELFKELIDENNNALRSNSDYKKIIPLMAKYHILINKNTTRLTNLVNDLLDVARFDSTSKFVLNKEKFDLIEEITHLIHMQLSKKLKQKKIQINFVYDNQFECLIYADRLRIGQVILNLINNAIKFSEIGDKIIISIKRTDKIFDNVDIPNTRTSSSNLYGINQGIDDRKKTKEKFVIVSISDTGRGISPKIKPRLFERFATDSESGTGLGLYISKNLVEAHGGKIWGYNNKKDKGATFGFSLPSIKE